MILQNRSHFSHSLASYARLYGEVGRTIYLTSLTVTKSSDVETGINEVKGGNAKVKVIYDLCGRRIDNITKPGIYIVDGKKVSVK